MRVLAVLRLRARGRHQGRRRIRHPDDELTGRFFGRASLPRCGCGRAAGIKDGAEFVIPTMN
ncbi:hypothetical protein [Mesorhizobium sp. WSM3873]|uniref:hypothetical protein n=1 Tax=Mesorhizobium sp. WSM3873 TaxID=1854056 RepID=UPI0007FD102A|nr:hypothetical protein [Mesorhizobium sp. WSM3873]OBQ78853.1 hypothetical protein A9K71_07675 [Mesorhizobium sp. WSM3873]